MSKYLFVYIFILILASCCYLFYQNGDFSTHHFSLSTEQQFILFEIRLPRLIALFLVGFGLGISGYLSQIIFNNPLADPYLLGTSTSASLGNYLAYSALYNAGLPLILYSFYQIVGAFLGAFAATLFCFWISYRNTHLSPYKLILTGIAVSSLSASFISYFVLTSSNTETKNLLYKLSGSFENVMVFQLPVLFITVFLLLIFSLRHFKKLNLLTVGDEQSQALGLNVSKLRMNTLILNALLVAILVWVSGPIGFVGLVVPHIGRIIFKSQNRVHQFIHIAFNGAFLLIFCDFVARYSTENQLLPIGVITSFLGVPFFLYLLKKRV